MSRIRASISSKTRLDAFVIEREAFDEQLLQTRRRPLAELGASRRTDAVADGQNGVEVVVVDEPGNLASPFGLNYPEFPDSCLRIEFLFVEDVDEMFVRGFTRAMCFPRRDRQGVVIPVATTP